MAVSVVDASALGAVLFAEPEADEVELRLRGAVLVAPSLIEFELGNTCLKKCRRHPHAAPALRAALASLRQLDLRLHDVDVPQTLALAEHHVLSFYDASYLWLARELGASLVSLDSRLTSAELLRDA
jgi:predicted nucleic acid-binding protein